MSALKFIRTILYRLELAIKLQWARWFRSTSQQLKSLELPNNPPIHNAAATFLEKYGRITFRGRATIFMTPMSCADDHNHIIRYREIDDRNYYPVGMINDECNTSILVDEDGSIYLFAAPPASDSGPWFVGHSLHDSAEAILT